MESLFGSEFEIDLNSKDTTSNKKVKSLVNKITSIVGFGDAATDAAIAKALKSDTLPIEDQLTIITDRVLKTLGKQRHNVQVITSVDELYSYISKAIANNMIAVDTETNNSLDPVTCRLMGLCLYTPGEKQAYIPVNHVNYHTKERIEPQLTEEDCKQALQRIIDNKCFIVMHNGKFDYEVLKETCHIDVKPDWDTMIAAALLDENEEVSLKEQYVKKIDPTQEKYDIEKLFTKVPYAYVDPNIFALYAATDSYMTYKLYEWQLPYMTAPQNERLYWVFLNIEMPIVIVTAEMELRGVCVDQEFGEHLKVKYNQALIDIDKKIEEVLRADAGKIRAWRLDPKNAQQTHVYPPKKTKKTQEAIEAEFNLTEETTGKRYKLGKSKASQLGDPINLASPTQLAILFYDIYKVEAPSRKNPRGTGEEELTAIAKRAEESGKPFPLCDLILERRGIVKLITSYIDTIPTLAQHWPDHRVRFHLRSLGTETGRYASGGKIKFMDEATDTPVVLSGINIQNIPSHNPEVRLLFKAATKYNIIEEDDNKFVISEIEEVNTPNGWKYGKDIQLGDEVALEEGVAKVLNITKVDKTYVLTLSEAVYNAY